MKKAVKQKKITKKAAISKTIWIDRSVLIAPFYIGICITEQAFTRELRRLKIPLNLYPDWIAPDSDAMVYHFENNTTNEKCCIVCVGNCRGKSRNLIMGLIVHEAVHVWQYVCDVIKEDKPSSELSAYAIQRISEKLWEGYEKLRKK